MSRAHTGVNGPSFGAGFVLALAASLREGDHWLRQRANVDGPEPGDQPSPWAISCAAAREAFDS
jgi:hypothetical protein